jgi:hypothetical protein
MAVQISRKVIDFFVNNYKEKSRSVTILPSQFDHSKCKARPEAGGPSNFIERWYMSLQGEGTPVFSGNEYAQENAAALHIYRYDWAFGITVIEEYWWDWMAELQEESALAVHVALKADDGAPETIPVNATVSALPPSRNTKSIWDVLWSKLPKAATEAAKVGASVIPALDYVSSGIALTANVLDSSSEGRKNWFLYQFLDEKLMCPTVEWRINRQVLREYGPLLRGSLYLAFNGSEKTSPGKVRLIFRPQIRYCNASDIDFIVPTDALKEEERVHIDVIPVDAKVTP